MDNTCACKSHSREVLQQRDSFIRHMNFEGKGTAIDGHSLDIATVVAVARHGALVHLHGKTIQNIAESAKLLQSRLAQGEIIYGVNTGFGGSADSRTKEVEKLQATLIRELHSGILEKPSTESGIVETRTGNPLGHEDTTPPGSEAFPLEDALSSNCMPETWVRASLLIRINSLASGHSGVRPVLINNMVELLRKDIVPRIPLRGSISASGDLMPLSYIGGTLEGKHGLTVWIGRRMERRTVTADIALARSSLDPIRLGPKEGLAIINGTAVSTGVAALAMHEAHNLAVLSQVLAAMSVEALCGTDESFDPFFAAVRPHSGQTEVARNIHGFLAGSKLVQDNHGLEEGHLRQDRYSIRTASQWLGPVLEDLVLASRQITIECNSVTDNPLINFDLNDSGRPRTYHGGNFQAKSITSAMEKVRLAIQTIGQMLFAQCTEIINPKLNNGLPPNLVVDEPSQSWLMKPLDIMIAALQSELGFLSNPAGTHVQSAEMGNQALNSLGLVSARYSHIALDILSQLASAHLFALCQALDLRAMQLRFLEAVEPMLRQNTFGILGNTLNNGDDLESFHALIWKQFIQQLNQTTTLDSAQRFSTIFRSLQPVVLDFASSSPEIVSLIRKWTARCSDLAQKIFLQNLESYHARPDALPFIGTASRRMYKFVRDELQIPFLRTTMLQNPVSDMAPGCHDHIGSNDVGKLNGDSEIAPGSATCVHKTPKRRTSECLDHQPLAKRSKSADNRRPRPGLTTGSLITTIYQSIRNGTLYGPVIDCLAEVQGTG